MRPEGENRDSNVTRRIFLAGGAAVAGAVVLSACNGGSGTSGPKTSLAGLPTTSGTGKPVRGGTLTLGTISGGTTETLIPILGYTDSDNYRLFQLYDQLVIPSPDLQSAVPRLALSIEPNKDASVWTVNLRDGVTFHDGKPFTADDVVYSIGQWTLPQSIVSGLASNIDVKGVRKRGELTVEVPLLTPDAQWPLTLCSFSFVVQDGSGLESTHPIGTGPFKYESFEPGRQSVFVANTDYWEEGKPYVDRVVIDLSFADDNARLNAVLSGAIDVMPSAPYLAVRTQQGAGTVTAFGSPSPRPSLFVMRVDEGPFTDPRVRQAMKLLVDRPALIEASVAGFATPGNDVLGQGSPYFASDLKATHDVDKARSLIKAAGMEGETFTLQTAPVIDGTVQAATLFAQQAQAAGITVKVEQISAASYYTPQGGLFSAPFRCNYYQVFASLSAYYSNYLVSSALLNETAWGRQPGAQDSDAMITGAMGATDPSRAQTLWHDVQQRQFDEGGMLVYANTAFVHLAATRVKGLTENQAGYLNSGRLYEAWVG